MKTNKSKNVFIFSKDLLLLEKIRKDIHSLNIQVFLFVNKQDYIENNKQDLIIIDQRYFNELKNLPNSYFTKMIYITNNSSGRNIEEILRNNANNILFLPLNYTFLFCLIKKHLGQIETKDCKETVYHGITLCKDSSSVTYNQCKVILTESEFATMQGIITNSVDSSILDATLQVTVCRINKKCKEGIGLKLIKKRRKKDYFISI